MEKIISRLLPTDVASKYLKDVLAVGGGSTSGAVDLRLSSKSICAIAPEGVRTAQLLDLDHGGLLDVSPKISDGTTSIQRVPTTVPIAASIVVKELSRCERPTLWIHEPLLTEDEIVLKKLPYEIVGGKIYLVFDSNLDEERVVELINYSLLSWHFLMFIIEGKPCFESVDELILSAKLILVGAYDGESFLYGREG